MTNTATTAPVITDAINFATEFGDRPFAGHVTVTANTWGGMDIANANSGETFRLTDDDGQITLHLFVNGRAMLLAGSQTFTGRLANGATIGSALAGLL